eukprot:300118-Rhodomonas_salina.1
MGRGAVCIRVRGLVLSPLGTPLRHWQARYSQLETRARRPRPVQGPEQPFLTVASPPCVCCAAAGERAACADRGGGGGG